MVGRCSTTRERDAFKTLITDDRSSFGGKGRSETAVYNAYFKFINSTLFLNVNLHLYYE